MEKKLYADSLGGPSTIALPANQSLIIADSRERSSNDTENVYNFTAYCNSAIVAKELIYSRLVWNQPLFTHNNVNNEFLFQVNNDTTTTYVAYAPPFIIFTEFDGNSVSTAGQTPKAGSYAYAMETILNSQVRNFDTNTILLNTSDPTRTGKVTLPISNNIVTFYFRYSASQGFFIYALDNTIPDAPVNIPIQLLPCGYIAFGHSIHGFGIEADTANLHFIPRQSFVACYYSDAIPTLLPFNTIVVVSQELTKDRRMISFHSVRELTNVSGIDPNQTANIGNAGFISNQGGTGQFASELAVFPLHIGNSAVRHEEQSGLDATVVSFRWGYQPQSFKIGIFKGEGNVPILDGDPISLLYQDQTIAVQNFASMVPYPGNTTPFFGDACIQNALIFGAVLNPYARLDNPFTNDRQIFSCSNVSSIPPPSYYYSWFIRLLIPKNLSTGFDYQACFDNNLFPLDVSPIYYVPTGKVDNAQPSELYGLSSLLPTVTNVAIPNAYFNDTNIPFSNNQKVISVFYWNVADQAFPSSLPPSEKWTNLGLKYMIANSIGQMFNSANYAPYNWPSGTRLAQITGIFYYDGVNPTATYTRFPLAYCANPKLTYLQPSNQSSPTFTWGNAWSSFATNVLFLNPTWPGTPDFGTPIDLITYYSTHRKPVPILLSQLQVRFDTIPNEPVPPTPQVPCSMVGSGFQNISCSVATAATAVDDEPIFYKEYITPVTNDILETFYPYGNPNADGLADDLIHEIGVTIGEGF